MLNECSKIEGKLKETDFVGVSNGKTQLFIAYRLPEQTTHAP